MVEEQRAFWSSASRPGRAEPRQPAPANPLELRPCARFVRDFAPAAMHRPGHRGGPRIEGRPHAEERAFIDRGLPSPRVAADSPWSPRGHRTGSPPHGGAGRVGGARRRPSSGDPVGPTGPRTSARARRRGRLTLRVGAAGAGEHPPRRRRVGVRPPPRWGGSRWRRIGEMGAEASTGRPLPLLRGFVGPRARAERARSARPIGGIGRCDWRGRRARSRLCTSRAQRRGTDL